MSAYQGQQDGAVVQASAPHRGRQGNGRTPTPSPYQDPGHQLRHPTRTLGRRCRPATWEWVHQRAWRGWGRKLCWELQDQPPISPWLNQDPTQQAGSKTTSTSRVEASLLQQRQPAQDVPHPGPSSSLVQHLAGSPGLSLWKEKHCSPH